MDISQLGDVGEFVSSLGVLVTLIFLVVEMRRNNRLQLRANANQAARDDVISLQTIIHEDVSELFLRGNEQGLASLTPHERYRFDLAYTVWLHPIQQAYADFHAGFYPAENLVPYENSLPGFLCTPGGAEWWDQRKFWFTNQFREDVERLLANNPNEAGFAGPRPRAPLATDSK